MTKKIKIAINGFGRIGRTFFRQAFGHPELDFVAVNDLSSTATLAYLLRYDTVYGRYGKAVIADDHSLTVGDISIRHTAEKEPKNLPWKELGVDVVVEATGFFTTSEKAKGHLEAGAKRVVITAPAKGDVATILVGTNDDRFTAKKCEISANASCTTNATAPVLAILRETFGIEKVLMTTIHGYTATQKLVDGVDDKDPRRGRAAAQNIVPSTTGAAEAVIQSIPEMAGMFDAVSVRVPTITGSLTDTTALLSTNVTIEEINEAFKKAAVSSRWGKVLKTTSDPIVSSDVVGEPYGAIIDLSLTRVVGGNLIKVFSWYDNEWGYSATLLEHVLRVGRGMTA